MPERAQFRPAQSPKGIESTSRPAGHLWASPFLRARKPKSSGRRRSRRWPQSPSGPERGGIVPERAHTPPGYTDDRPKERKTNFTIHGQIGAHLLAPQFVRQDPIKFKKGHCRVRKIGRPTTSTAKARGLRPRLEPSLCSGTINGVLKLAPPPHGSCLLLFLGCDRLWGFRLSLLRVRRPWPGPCTMAGAGAGPHPAARTTPPPHFKGKTVNNCTAGHRKARPALGAENPATSQGPNNAARKNRGPPITHGTEFHGLPNRRPMGAPRNSKALVEIHPALLIIAYE